jgi:hypothetical protein
MLCSRLILETRHLTINYAATVVCVTAAQCRDLADDHKGRAREAGISQKRAVLLTNIARSFSGLASQLEILAVDMAEEAHKGYALVSQAGPRLF